MFLNCFLQYIWAENAIFLVFYQSNRVEEVKQATALQYFLLPTATKRKQQTRLLVVAASTCH